MSNLDLTERQKHFLNLLPSSKHEVAEKMNISPNTAKGYVERLREKGINLSFDEQSGEYYLSEDSRKLRRISTKHKGTITKEANEWATEMEKSILRRLNGKEPLQTSDYRPSGDEDFVVHFTDLHLGDVVEDETGREVYNSEIAVESVEELTRNSLQLKQMMEENIDFSQCHLCWGGDMITNENIYDGQSYDIDSLLADQMSLAVDALVQQAETFAQEFEQLQIVAVMGNHGDTRASGVSKQANMDLLLYRWVEDRLIDKGYENINFVSSEASYARNFFLRDGDTKGQIRHGQNAKVHADSTSSSESEWRGWHIASQADFYLRGHYHEARYEEILNDVPIIMSPSPKPGGEYIDSLGSPDVSLVRKLGTVFGVSDDRPVTWKFIVDDQK